MLPPFSCGAAFTSRAASPTRGNGLPGAKGWFASPDKPVREAPRADPTGGHAVVLQDAPGLVAELTELLATFGMLIVGHTGERRRVPGPVAKYQSGQKFIVMLPHEFDHLGFAREISELVKKHRGSLQTPLRTVPGLLWWW